MRKLHTRKGGFTLIELMIVVAIIGILAAIAIPNFLMFQLRSKTGEAKTNLAAIRTAEEGYFAEFGTYVLAAAHGNTGLTPTKQSWGTGNAGFQQLGWAPEGEVFYQYQVTATGPGALTQYTADAKADLDGSADGNDSDFGYVHPLPGAAAGLAGALGQCLGAGVSDGTAAGTLLNAVGPCTNLDGQSEF